MITNRAEIRRERERLEAEAKQKQAELDAKYQESLDSDIDELREHISMLATDAGMSTQTFVEKYLLNWKRPAKSAAKTTGDSSHYVNPHKPGESWSGKGPAPKWFNAACEHYKRESLREGRTPEPLPTPEKSRSSNGVATPPPPVAH